MQAHYRINWKSGMRLSDAVFNASDQYHISQLAPLYEMMLNGGYGHLAQPRFRCEIDNSEMSVIEMSVVALTPDGDLMNVQFDHNKRDLFQKLSVPEDREPFVVYLEQLSSEYETFEDSGIPYKALKSNLIFKSEAQSYSNPNAVAVARFEYKQCWMMDNSFIPPCICVKANSDLWNLAHVYSRVLQDLLPGLKSKISSEFAPEVVSLLPLVSSLSIEIRKEIDEMSPKHLITIMQKVIGSMVAVFHGRVAEMIPEKESCEAFVELEYIPNGIGQRVNEGIRLTQLLNQMVMSLRQPVTPEPQQQVMPRMPRQPRVLDTSSERKSFKTRK